MCKLTLERGNTMNSLTMTELRWVIYLLHWQISHLKKENADLNFVMLDGILAKLKKQYAELPRD